MTLYMRLSNFTTQAYEEEYYLSFGYKKLNKITTMYEYLGGLNTLIEGSKDGKKNTSQKKNNNCT